MADNYGNVMVVDDDAHIRIAVQTLLTDAGFTVISVDSGEKCIELLGKGFSGLILLDVMMPQMDGWDTIRAILDKGLENGIAIIMLTANNAPDTKMIGLQEYVIDYITKPFDAEDLIEKSKFFMSYIENPFQNRNDA